MFTVLALHGSAQNEASLTGFIADIAPGMPCRCPRGPFAAGEGFTFFRRRPDRSIDPNELLELASRQSISADGVVGADAKALLVVGYSSGAGFAEALLAVRPDVFVGAILLRPEPISARFTFPALHGKPVLVLSGLRDERRRPDDPLQLVAQLSDAGAVVTHHALDAGHGWAPNKADTTLARAWLAGCFR
ncbi:alpha/beta hydrolase [Tabrizicola sp.]|uniref:alpha/beta hydrolase n=1 Tax=Tabrizicola sp. TaxID=2005166 RepID=UPI003F41040F